MGVTIKQVQAAIKDFNKVMTPAAKLPGLGEKGILEGNLVKAIGDAQAARDPRVGELGDATVETFNVLCGFNPDGSVPEKADAGTLPAPGESGEAPPPAPPPPAAAKETKAERAAGKAKAKADKAAERAEKKAARVAVTGRERYGYMQAVCDAIRSGPMDRTALAAKTLELYGAGGGKGDLVQAERNMLTALRPLIIMGVVDDVDGVITIRK